MSSSLGCDSINSEDEQGPQPRPPPPPPATASKDYNDDEELDFEEDEDVADARCKTKNDEEEEYDDDGELNDENESVGEQPPSDKQVKISKPKSAKNVDKDEGEIDSDELEEGEVKEDSENEETTGKDNQDEPNVQASQKNSEPAISYRNNRPLLDDPPRRAILPRPPVDRRFYHHNWMPQPLLLNQNYRFPPRMDRYGHVINMRPREPLHLPLPNSGSGGGASGESAWERGLKQARELITRASKRKEAEEEEKLEQNKRHCSGSKYERSPPPAIPPLEKRSRRYSHDSSSEDEFERRHRLAYDAAPWNNPGSSSNTSHTQNYRRSNYYSSSGRSAEAYRDPWRRSHSPKNMGRDRMRSREDSGPVASDERYGSSATAAVFKRRDKSRSHSMSSLSSICSSSSAKSSGRKLPYSRPPPPPSPPIPCHRADDKEMFEPERQAAKTRFDRIPKKSNASSRDNRDGERNSHAKSFDSWSDSLSDSSSYYCNSDSDGGHGAKEETPKSSRKLVEDVRSKATGGKKVSGNKEITPAGSSSGRPSKYGHATTKVPIKMTFMKKQASLKKDVAIDEQLNGGNISDLEEGHHHSNLSRISRQEEKSMDSKHDDDEEEGCDEILKSKSSPKEPTKRDNRREELLLKLRAVEEAIERKLSSKN